jgi:hypothetical protein
MQIQLKFMLRLGYGWFDTAVHVVTSNDAWTWGNGKVSNLMELQVALEEQLTMKSMLKFPVGDLIEHKFLSGVSANFIVGYQHFRWKKCIITITADSYA